MLKKFRMMLAGAIAAVVVISGSNVGWMQQTEVQAATDLSQVPGYTGSPYTVVNDNEPDFAKSDFTTDAFETIAIWIVLGDAVWLMQTSAKS